MEWNLVIKASPLFIMSSTDEEKPCSHIDNKPQISPDFQGFCCSDVLDHSTVFPREVQFPAETSFLTPGWVEEEGRFHRPLKSNRNNSTKQESKRILDMIKYSPKFLRKKNAKQLGKNVSPSALEEMNDVLQGELNQKLERNPGSVSPKTGFGNKVPLSVSPNDTAVLEYKTAGPALGTDCKSEISEQDISELAPSKGRKNWRKVKAALKRMNDRGEELNMKAVLASSEENTQGDAKLRIKLPCVEMSIQDHDENEEDIYQRLKAFLGMRRCSAPELVLRREAEALSLMKKAKGKEVTLTHTQNKSMKYKKDHGLQNHSRKQEVQERMRLIMEKSLQNLKAYCPEMCGQLNMTISEEITQYVQSTDVGSEDEQKKVVCLVYIGAVKDDGIHAAVRCMWIPGEDHLVVSDYHNHSLYALAVVFTASC